MLVSDSANLQKKALGKSVRDARDRREFTQEDLAAFAKVALTSIKALENGRAWPRIENLVAIADALGVEVRAGEILHDPTEKSLSPTAGSNGKRAFEPLQDLTKEYLTKYESDPESISSPEVRLLLSDVVFFAGVIEGLQESIRSGAEALEMKYQQEIKELKAKLEVSQSVEIPPDVMMAFRSFTSKRWNTLRAFMGLPKVETQCKSS